jgi:phosphoglycolate phosphatase-like HAD superfamily hydrolase
MAYHQTLRLLFQYYALWELRDEALHDLCDTNWSEDFLDSVTFWMWANNVLYLHDAEKVLFVGDSIKDLLSSLAAKLESTLSITEEERCVAISLADDTTKPLYWIRKA